MSAQRSIIAALGTALAMVALTVLSPPTAGLGNGAAAAPGAAPTIRMASQTAWAERSSIWVLNLEVTAAPPGSRVTTRVFRALSSRAEFRQSLTASALRGPLPDAQVKLTPIDVDQLPPADASGAQPVRIAIGVADTTDPGAGQVGLTQFGVHPVEVTVSDAGGRPLTRLVTHLVRLPDPGDRLTALATAVVLPIDGPPAATAEGRTEVTPQLRTSVNAPVDALAIRPDLPVTVVPSPETVAAVTESATDLGAGALDRMKAALSGHHQVLADTYAGVDVPAWIQAGMNNDLVLQLLRGVALVKERLGVQPTSQTQRTESDATPSALAWRRSVGAERLLVPEAALAPLDPDNFSRPLTHPFLVDVPGGDPLPAAQLDAGLSEAFTRNPADPVLSGHQLLAELATLYGENPSSTQGVVVAPPSRSQPAPILLDTLLDGLQQQAQLLGQPQSPILAPVTVDELFQRVPLAGRTGVDNPDGPRLTRPLTHTSARSLGAFPQHLHDANALLTDYESMLVEPSPRTSALQTRLLVAGSDQLSSTERIRRVKVVDATVTRQLAGIELPANQTVTLAAADADIPLTIRNTTDQKLRVRVELSASKRLEFPPKPIEPAPLNPGESRRFKVRVHTLGSGITPLLITLRTPSGRKLTDTRYRVQSTAVSGVGLVITVGAAGFLVLWWASHWRRARRDRRSGRHSPHTRRTAATDDT